MTALVRRRERGTLLWQLAPLTVFLATFFVAPLVVFFIYSLWRTSDFRLLHEWSLGSYADVVADPINRRLVLRTVEIALEASIATTVMAYAFAHQLRFHLRRWQEPLLFAVLVALFSGYLVRIYAWTTILGNNGILNETLERVGVVERPLSFLLYSRTAAIIVLTNFLVPLAILPIYAALQDVDDRAVEASRDLGCRPRQALLKVTVPLAWPGIFAAWALSFIIAAGDYITPQLVGGTSGTMIGRIVAADFNDTFDWSHGAALAFVGLTVVLAIVALIRRAGALALR
jgi:spermidine/putrescine transport system permease protein